MRTRELEADVKRQKRKFRQANLESLLATGLEIDDAASQLGIPRATARRWFPANSNHAAVPSANPSARLTRRGAELLPLVCAIHEEYLDAGAPTIARLLADQVGEHASKNTIAAVMRHVGIQGARYEKRAQIPMNYADNLLKRDWRTRNINQAWVGDTTQIRVAGNRWLYLAAVLDLHSRQIIGFAIGPVNDSRLTGSALQMAYRERNPPPGCIYHTDRGAPYCSAQHVALIAALGLVRSNSGLGKCHDNACMESAFSLLKRILRVRLEGVKTTTVSYRSMRAKLLDLIDYYNHQRLHGSTGGYSPVAFEALPLETRQAIHARLDAVRERRKAARMAEIAARKRATCGVMWAVCLMLGMPPANDAAGAIGRAA
jgi:transposase InsO family protein